MNADISIISYEKNKSTTQQYTLLCIIKNVRAMYNGKKLYPMGYNW